MDNITSTVCVNGELKPGDLVLSTPADEYACLVGTVLSINKLGTPEHDAETENDTDDVHVNFIDSEYSERRIVEIEEMFSDLYNQPKTFEECPIDDTIMSPDTLIRITDIGGDLLSAILDSMEAAEALCKLIEIGPGTVHYARPAEQEGHIVKAKMPPTEHGEDTQKQELFDRLERNYDDMMSVLRGDITRPDLSQQELVNKAGEIVAVDDAHFYMTEHYTFDASEVEYLLQFQNPLEVVSDAWYRRTEDISDMSFALHEVFDKRDALQDGYPLMSDAPAVKENGHGSDAAEKPSVLDRIRDAARAPKEPRGDKPARDKSGPEH